MSEDAQQPVLGATWQERFLQFFAETGLVAHSAKLAGVDRVTPCRLRKTDGDFRRKWEQAKRTASELLEKEARRRAVDGTEKPVYQGGVLVGYVREYSDSLLSTLLKANLPGKFRDRSSVEQNIHQTTKATVTLNEEYDLSQLSDEQLARLEEIKAAARRKANEPPSRSV